MQFKSGYRFPYNFTRDYLRPSHYWYYVKYRWQRSRRGWSEYDLWFFDDYIVHVLIEMLPRLKNSDPYCYVLQHRMKDQEVVFQQYPYRQQFSSDEAYEVAIAEVKEKHQTIMNEWDAWIDSCVERLRDVYDYDRAYALGEADEAEVGVRASWERERERYNKVQDVIRELADEWFTLSI